MLIATSIVIPIAIYVFLLKTNSISRRAVLFFAFILVALSVADFYLLQTLSTIAKISVSAHDDKIFASEISIALYLFPVVFGGIGVNLMSNVLSEHLAEAERNFDKNNPRL